MKKILLISTGGTFNKSYDSIKGTLMIDNKATALYDIATRWLCDFDIKTIIDKDSLDMNDEDRELLLHTIMDANEEYIIIIHGTDTMDQSASVVADANLSKKIIFTGSMVPYSINPVEATANLSSAWGYLQAEEKSGVYIAMNSRVGRYEMIEKDRVQGRFVEKVLV